MDVVQLVRAPDCGSGGRGFESHRPPHFFSLRCAEKSPPAYWDIAKSVRQRTLTPSFRRFESCYPSQKKSTCYCKCFFQLYSPYGELYAPSVRDICFASDIGLRPVLKANIISLKPQVSISHFAQAKYITPSKTEYH